MGAVCEKHDVKLLTYGTLVCSYHQTYPLNYTLTNQCGGFLAEKWLGKAEPGLYDSEITPSQRKVRSVFFEKKK
jgi:hypothetical protein